jgi:hypothetical protein
MKSSAMNTGPLWLVLAMSANIRTSTPRLIVDKIERQPPTGWRFALSGGV